MVGRGLTVGRFTETEIELANSVRRALTRLVGDLPRFDPHDKPDTRALWTALGSLGVWQAAADTDFPSNALAVRVGQELGAVLAPGPFAQSLGALALLPPDRMPAALGGDVVITTGTPRRVAWGRDADEAVVLDGDQWYLLRGADLLPADDLAGRWARADHLLLDGRLSVSAESSTLAHRSTKLAELGYLWGGARAMVTIATEHAQKRIQFGRVIGEFQAVSHQLVDATLSLESAEATLVAAARLTDDGGAPDRKIAFATMSVVEAARRAVAASHQVLGAFGYTLEGPLVGYTMTIQRTIALSVDLPEARRVVAASLSEGVTRRD